MDKKEGRDVQKLTPKDACFPGKGPWKGSQQADGIPLLAGLCSSLSGGGCCEGRYPSASKECN